MNRIRVVSWLGLAATIFLTTPAAMSADACLAESRTPVVLGTGFRTSSGPTGAYLVASLAPELRILDAGTGRLLWSAGATGGFTQRFPAMTAGFTSSISPIDMNGDGAHDRIYAGDVDGRLWRFDLGGSGSLRITGGVFADLREGVIGRGFVAAPDVTLMAPAVGTPWLSIAVGTANTTPAMAVPTTPSPTHRFFVLRDRGPFERWTQGQHDRWRPLVMADLALVERPLADLPLAEGHGIDPMLTVGAGFYLNLGSSQVIAPALTLDGKTIFTVAHTTQSQLFPCGSGLQTRVSVSVGSVSATDGSPAMDLDGNGSRDAADLHLLLERPADAASAVTLVREDGTEGTINCSVAGQVLAGCDLDTSLHGSFWRREDAD